MRSETVARGVVALPLAAVSPRSDCLLTGSHDLCNNDPMSNTAPRTAESTVHTWSSEGSFDTKYETDYRFAKRQFGGWSIYLTNPNAQRTVETDSVVSPTATTDGYIGWVVKSRDGKGWDLHHAKAGELESSGYGRGWATRDEAAEELIWSLLARHIVSPARQGTQIIARDTIDHNELVTTASQVVEKFAWEIEYDAYLAAKN